VAGVGGLVGGLVGGGSSSGQGSGSDNSGSGSSNSGKGSGNSGSTATAPGTAVSAVVAQRNATVAETAVNGATFRSRDGRRPVVAFSGAVPVDPATPTSWQRRRRRLPDRRRHERFAVSPLATYSPRVRSGSAAWR
jgi:hypothetical protein